MLRLFGLKLKICHSVFWYKGSGSVLWSCQDSVRKNRVQSSRWKLSFAFQQIFQGIVSFPMHYHRVRHTKNPAAHNNNDCVIFKYAIEYENSDFCATLVSTSIIFFCFCSTQVRFYHSSNKLTCNRHDTFPTPKLCK